MGQPINKLLMAQTGGSPYDEEAYMRVPVPINESDLYGLYSGGNSEKRGYRLAPEMSPVNQFLNERMGRRMEAGRNVGPSGGSDMDMMRIYGPEDQVAYDANGNPIPLADPRHPQNQAAGNALMRSYPQQRR